MFDVIYRAKRADGSWGPFTRYGVALPGPKAQAFADALMTSPNGAVYEACPAPLVRKAVVAVPVAKDAA